MEAIEGAWAAAGAAVSVTGAESGCCGAWAEGDMGKCLRGEPRGCRRTAVCMCAVQHTYLLDERAALTGMLHWACSQWHKGGGACESLKRGKRAISQNLRFPWILCVFRWNPSSGCAAVSGSLESTAECSSVWTGRIDRTPELHSKKCSASHWSAAAAPSDRLLQVSELILLN